MPDIGNNADTESKASPNKYEQELSNLIEEWEEKARSAQEAINQAKAKLVEHAPVEVERSEKENTVAVEKEQVFADIKKKLDRINDNVMKGILKRVEKSS